MSKNPVIKSRYAAPYTLQLKLSEKAGLYYVISGAEQTGKANFFPGGKKYWNTDEDIAAAEQHLVAILNNKCPEVAEAFGVNSQKDHHSASVTHRTGEEDMVDSPYGLVTQDQYDVMVGGENTNNIQVPGPINKEEKEMTRQEMFDFTGESHRPLEFAGSEDMVISNKDIGIGLSYLKDETTGEYSVSDGLWHIITMMDQAMLCRLNCEDWDDVAWGNMKMVSGAEILTQEDMCPLCRDKHIISSNPQFEVSDPFCPSCGAILLTEGQTVPYCVVCDFNNNKEEEGMKLPDPKTNRCIGCMYPEECCIYKITEDNGVDPNYNGDNIGKESMITSLTKTKENPFFCVNCKGYHTSANDMRICMGMPVVDQPLVKNTPFTWTTEGGKEVHFFKTMREALIFKGENNNVLIKPTKNNTGYNVFPTAHPYSVTTKKTEFKSKCGVCKEIHTASTQSALKSIIMACTNKPVINNTGGK